MTPNLVKSTLAVIVLYEKDIIDSRSFKDVAPLMGEGLELLIFDNSKTGESQVPEGVQYHHAEDNPGVSGAYNFAASLARKSGKSWLWLLDDDTATNASMLSEAQEVLQSEKAIRLFVPRVYSGGKLLSPFSFVGSTPRRLKSLPQGINSLLQLRPINSGMLVHLATFEQTGGYEARLPLDFSDIEFTDRLSGHCSEFYICAARFEQAFSGDEKSSKQAALTRFRLFARAARLYYQKAEKPAAVKQQVLKRALRLSLRYLSPAFIIIFTKTTFVQ